MLRPAGAPGCRRKVSARGADSDVCVGVCGGVWVCVGGGAVLKGAGLLESDIEYIKSELGVCDCGGKLLSGEPYTNLVDEGGLKKHNK